LRPPAVTLAVYHSEPFTAPGSISLASRPDRSDSHSSTRPSPRPWRRRRNADAVHGRSPYSMRRANREHDSPMSSNARTVRGHRGTIASAAVSVIQEGGKCDACVGFAMTSLPAIAISHQCIMVLSRQFLTIEGRSLIGLPRGARGVRRIWSPSDWTSLKAFFTGVGSNAGLCLCEVQDGDDLPPDAD
jgi:hypothetical protein